MVNTNAYNPKPAGELESTNSATQHEQALGRPPLTYPYRRGLSCLLRGLFGTFSTAVIAISVWLLTSDGLGEKVPRKTFAAPIATAALSMLINYFALISAILRRYGPLGHWRWMMALDPIPAALGLWAFVVFGYNIKGDVIAKDEVDWRGKKVEDYKPMLRELVAVLALVVAIFHLVATLGGLVGLFLVSRRRKAYEAGGRVGPGSKLFAWADPERSGKVEHTGYPAPN
ncbi:hypothetical protein B0T16DRAFT_462341 [Cercophora newfieldiana]|uniref:Uncharacterized protein n=1 Tax=Cercophora newfieldiana TaxID=92897 RepID=A0AA40CIC0_9PEZI|nr:hypothetical protein B0T16DRAFT_462341 [Cercophora newfieldiana]